MHIFFRPSVDSYIIIFFIVVVVVVGFGWLNSIFLPFVHIYGFVRASFEVIHTCSFYRLSTFFYISLPFPLRGLSVSFFIIFRLHKSKSVCNIFIFSPVRPLTLFLKNCLLTFLLCLGVCVYMWFGCELRKISSRHIMNSIVNNILWLNGLQRDR